MSDRKEVDFIWVWFEKCWTTLFAKLLEEHPEIFIPKEKELNHFTSLWALWEDNKINFQKKSISEYYKYFSSSEKSQIIWEWSINYTNKESAKLIKSFFPNVKIIISVRNPIKKIESSFNYHKYTKLDISGKIDINDFIYKYPYVLEQCKYFKIINFYEKLFSKEKIHIIKLEDYIKSPILEVKKMYDFLWVDKNYKPLNINKKINKTTKTKHPLLIKTIKRLFIIWWKIARKIWVYKFLINSKAFKKSLEITNNIKKQKTELKREKLNNKTRKIVEKTIKKDLVKLKEIYWINYLK